MATRTTWRTAALLEVAAMVVVLLSYIWVWRGAFAGASLLMLVLYFGLGFKSHLRSGETPRQLGFRTDNLVRALVNAATFVVPAIVVLLAIGLALESWHFNSWSRVLEGAPFMLVWATAQQYGLLCFFYRRFLEIFEGPLAATAGTAVTFAVFHMPNGFLVGVTLVAGVVACVLYRRETNLFAVGAAHALTSYFLLSSLPDSVTHGLRVGPSYLANL